MRKELAKTKDLLVLPRLSSVQEIPDQDGTVRKALLLRETVKHDGRFVREWSGMDSVTSSEWI